MPASKFTRADCRGGKACIKEDMKHAMKIVKKRIEEIQKQIGPKIRDKMIAENRRGYRQGIKDAASFAGTWDQQITGTEFKFKDLILLKFNLLGKRKPRRKVMQLRTLREKAEAMGAQSLLGLMKSPAAEARVKAITAKDDEYLKGIMKKRRSR